MWSIVFKRVEHWRAWLPWPRGWQLTPSQGVVLGAVAVLLFSSLLLRRVQRLLSSVQTGEQQWEGAAKPVL